MSRVCPNQPVPIITSTLKTPTGTAAVQQYIRQVASGTSPHCYVRVGRRTIIRPKATKDRELSEVTLDRNLRTVVISIFQITISPRHGGASQGYQNIRSIMMHVKELLKHKHKRLKVKVNVVYFLVSPDKGDESQNQWLMPRRLGRNCYTDDHRGPLFCIRIHTPGTSRLSTLNFAT